MTEMLKKSLWAGVPVPSIQLQGSRTPQRDSVLSPTAPPGEPVILGPCRPLPEFGRRLGVSPSWLSPKQAALNPICAREPPRCLALQNLQLQTKDMGALWDPSPQPVRGWQGWPGERLPGNQLGLLPGWLWVAMLPGNQVPVSLEPRSHSCAQPRPLRPGFRDPWGPGVIPLA